MPNRIIRDGLLTSPKIDQLDFPSEVMFFRLMLVADDFGRFHGDPLLIRSYCYPLKTDRVRTTDITRWLAICEKAGLLVCYEAADRKQYVQICNFGQRVRAEKSKFPDPPKEMTDKCGQLAADDRLFGDGDGVEDGDDNKRDEIEQQATEVYEAYPKKVGRPKAIAAIRKALRKMGFQELLTKTKGYADHCAGKDPQFIPYPTTWFNQERFNDPNEYGKNTPNYRQNHRNFGRPATSSNAAEILARRNANPVAGEMAKADHSPSRPEKS